MNRMLKVAVAVMLFAISASAAPHKLTAVPRALGRTAANMVTFKDKTAALEQWASLGITVADGLVSEHALKSAPANTIEVNPIFGSHPTTATYLAINIPFGMLSATMTQLAHEDFDHNGGVKRTVWPSVIQIGAHTAGIAWSEHQLHQECSRAGIQCR